MPKLEDVVIEGDGFTMRLVHHGYGSIKMDAEIESTLGARMGEMDDPVVKAAVDAVESLVLAHYCANVDVNGRDYLHGLNVAVEAIGNNLP